MAQVLFEGNLASIYVLPEHIWSAEDPQEFGNEEMIGSGPFTLVEAEQNVSVELAANPGLLGHRRRHRRGHLPDAHQCRCPHHRADGQPSAG